MHRSRFLGLGAAAFAALAAPARAAIAPPTLFSYEAKDAGIVRGRPLDIGGVRTLELTYASTVAGKSIAATYVGPAGDGPAGAGILFVHRLGEDSQQTNRTEFRPDALDLARSGIASLAIDTMWSAPKWFTTRQPAGDFDASVAQVKDLRRALDVLQTFIATNARTAYVGHDFGAMYGAVLAGIDDRVRNAAFMTPTTSLADWYLLGKKPDNPDAYRARMDALNPLPYVRMSHLENVLLQFSRNDTYVPADRADQWAAAMPATARTTLDRYDADHALQLTADDDDRRAWLRSVLLPKP